MTMLIRLGTSLNMYIEFGRFIVNIRFVEVTEIFQQLLFVRLISLDIYLTRTPFFCSQSKRILQKYINCVLVIGSNTRYFFIESSAYNVKLPIEKRQNNKIVVVWSIRNSMIDIHHVEKQTSRYFWAIAYPNDYRYYRYIDNESILSDDK